MSKNLKSKILDSNKVVTSTDILLGIIISTGAHPIFSESYIRRVILNGNIYSFRKKKIHKIINNFV